METIVDVVGNVEAELEECIASQEAADPVVYQLVRVDGNGLLVPATDDEVLAVEDLLEECKSKVRTPDTGQTLESSADSGCGPCDSSKAQVKGSEGSPPKSRQEVLEGYEEKPNISPEPAMDQDEKRISSLVPNSRDDKGVCQSGSPERCCELPGRLDDGGQTSSPTNGPGLKPNFSLLNGEIHLDCLSVRDLQETFRATFGRETSVKDKQWLKRRIIMGLTNSCDFSITSFTVIDNKVVKKGKEQACKNADCSVLFDGVSTSAIESHQRPSSLEDNPVEINVVANETNLQSPNVQENHGSQDASIEQRSAKRIRKPTKRYIEELSGESRDSSAKITTSVKQPLYGQPPAIICEVPVRQFRPDGRCLIREDSLGGSEIQVPYVSRIRRSRPRENYMSLMKLHTSGLGTSTKLEKNDVGSIERIENKSSHDVAHNNLSPKCIQELAGASSETSKIYVETTTVQPEKEVKNMESCKSDVDDDVATVPTANGGMRRKHHRPWTLTEVVNLVEGVAKYGAGRWSEIKRVSFASYSYRTSVDLKDKWRNLMRASVSELATGTGINGSRKQASVSIPAPILSRVRELANIHTPVPPSIGSNKPSGHNDSTGTVQEETRTGVL